MNINTDFNFKTLHLKPAKDGECVATFISSKRNTNDRKAVLYLHGWADYFHQAHVAEKFNDDGYDFYALDFRRHGRSLLPHQHANFYTSIEVLFEELDASIDLIRQNNNLGLYLLGHSCGGLISSMYLNKGSQKETIEGLILTGPFFGINEPKIKLWGSRIANAIFGELISTISIQDGLKPAYHLSLHKKYKGEWEYDETVKPLRGFKARYGWVNAVDTAQKYLSKHSNIQQPILLLHAATSKKLRKFSEDAFKSDIVLNIEDMKRVGPLLGNDVEIVAIKDAIHDLYISRKEVRDHAIQLTLDWLAKH